MSTTTATYVLSPQNVQEAPHSFLKRIKYLGPGFILSASIVGSGELIATTLLGAKAGFIAFWVIILSCLVKVAVQLEFGKYAIYSGETTMEGFNRLPGPKWGKANWSIWVWLVLMFLKILQIGGILGGGAIILNMVFPGIPLSAASLGLAVLVSLLIFQGFYKWIELISLVLIGCFTFFTLLSLGFLQETEMAITWLDIQTGLSFQLPANAVLIAIGAFGITGVGGDEIMAYNYWLIEKGYAAYTGPNDQSEEWKSRAKGWIRVMYLDAILSMVVYTVMTSAFYLLGAAVLHRQGLLPEGMELVETLSKLYTETLGPGARNIFLVGAFVVLFSTLFAALAAWTRLFSDAFGQIGIGNFRDPKSRKKSIAAFAWFFPITWAFLFLLIKTPAEMVIIGGVITTVILFIVVYAAIFFRYKILPDFLTPSKFYDVALFMSVIAISLVGIYSLWKVF